jgi:hypothetical protein
LSSSIHHYLLHLRGSRTLQKRCAPRRPPQAAPLLPELLRRALELVRECSCTGRSGCPACVQHTACSEYNAGAGLARGRVAEEGVNGLRSGGWCRELCSTWGFTPGVRSMGYRQTCTLDS